MRCSTLMWTGLAVGMLSSHTFAQHHPYDEWQEGYTAQALLGAVRFENLKITDDSGLGDPKEIDLSTLPQLGGAWSTLSIGTRFQYGLEATFLLGFRVDKINYISAGGGGLEVSISTLFWMFDLAGGPYINLFLDPQRRVRMYGGAGPLMIYADYRSEREESGAGGDTTFDQNESAFGMGVYARAGLEYRIHERGMLGLGMRGQWAHLDFAGVGGQTKVIGMAAFATYTAGF